MPNRRVVLAVQGLVTVGLVFVLFRQFDWQVFSGVFARMSWRFYLGSLFAVAAGQVIYAFRWKTVLDALGVVVSYGEVLRQYLIGLFFTNVMPTAVGGDAAKVYLLGRSAGYVEIGASVFVDRVLGFLWLSVIGAALAWSTAADSPVLILNRNLLTVFAAIFLSALAVAKTVPLTALIERVVPKRWPAVANAAGSFDALVRRGVLTATTLTCSGVVVATYALMITAVYRAHFAANGIDGVALPAVMMAVISMAVFVNVPISVNGIGLREQLHVLLFSTLGVPKEIAVSIALVLFAHTLVLSAAGAMLWFRVRPA